jgi:hypothetical protein
LGIAQKRITGEANSWAFEGDSPRASDSGIQRPGAGSIRDPEIKVLENPWFPRPWSMDLGGHGLGNRYLAGQQTTRISITDLKKIQLLAQRRFNTR